VIEIKNKRCLKDRTVRANVSCLCVAQQKKNEQKKGLEIFAWCIMTNHVHLIARAKENGHPDIEADTGKSGGWVTYSNGKAVDYQHGGGRPVVQSTGVKQIQVIRRKINNILSNYRNGTF
jgi:hypothetical protein